MTSNDWRTPITPEPLLLGGERKFEQHVFPHVAAQIDTSCLPAIRSGHRSFDKLGWRGIFGRIAIGDGYLELNRRIFFCAEREIQRRSLRQIPQWNLDRFGCLRR